MDLEEKITIIKNQTSCPVFTARNGNIKEVNMTALRCGINARDNVYDIIYSGLRDYKRFKQGTLYLAIRVKEKIYNATVIRQGTTDTFILDSEYISYYHKQLSILSDKLREPLADAMFALDMLCKQQNYSNNTYMMELKHSFARLHRTFYNMGSLPDNSIEPQSKKSNQNVTQLVEEIAQDTQTVIASAGYKLKYDVPKKQVLCYIDHEKVKQAIMNMLANAMKYTRPKKTIHIKMRKRNDLCTISVTNFFEDPSMIDQFDIFSILSHAPNNEQSEGIGLGLKVIRMAATAHGGALLMDRPDDHTMQLSLTIPVVINTKTGNRGILRTFRKLPTNYTGGYNFILTELSDILPKESFK